tara:strand:- start:647 stop:856 length:210 start_codon:yes stop_codon:yes gene_type:complete
MNKETELLESRIIDLEIKFSHQEDLLAELNKIVTQHEFTIDKMIKEINELKLTSISGQSDGGQEKPPHY